MLCVIALLNQVLERCSRRCWMSGKFPNLGTFARDMWGSWRMFFMNLYCMPSHMFMFLDDAVMVVMWPYSKRGRTNVLYRRSMVAGEGPYDCLYIVCRRMMRCLALDAVMLWVLNESDESNVTPRNFALL